MDAAVTAAWADQDTPAFVLTLLALDRNPGEDHEDGSPVNWTPATWADEVRAETGKDPDPQLLHRLMAGLTLLHSPDEFYRSPAGFHTLCEALAGDGFDPSASHPLSAGEIAWAALQAHLIRPDPAGYAETVVELVRRVCVAEGFGRAPPLLQVLGFRPAENGLPDLLDLPELAAVATQAREDLERDLASWFGDKVRDLAARLTALPLSGSDPRPVADALLRSVARHTHHP